MFTGIVAELGRIAEARREAGGATFVIDAPETVRDLSVGDSVAVNGVCLTAVAVTDEGFTVEAVSETMGRSNLGGLAPGDRIDLERPTEVGGRFDGHVVQGHVDGVGLVTGVSAEDGAARVRVEMEAALGRYVVEKGSITVDGVSLTVTAAAPVGADPSWFEVVLIPHTLDVTVLGSREPGDAVNLEVDVMAKYVERMLEAHR
ncbi:MAG: riboflavin synthase [Acidimicrobiia bacterium]